jgi:hypothetical protein
VPYTLTGFVPKVMRKAKAKTRETLKVKSPKVVHIIAVNPSCFRCMAATAVGDQLGFSKK